MDFEERAVFPAQLAEGMQCLDCARALRPTAARSTRQSHDCDGAAGQRIHASLSECGGKFACGIDDIFGPDIRDAQAASQTILREPNPSAYQIGADLLMLLSIKSELIEQRRQVFS